MKKTVVKVLLMALGLVLSSGAPTQLDLAIAARNAAKPNAVRQLATLKSQLTTDQQALDGLYTQYFTAFVAAQVNGFGSCMTLTNLWVNVAIFAAKIATQVASTLNSDSVMTAALIGANSVNTTLTRRALTGNLNAVFGDLSGIPIPTFNATDIASITPFIFPVNPAIVPAAKLGSALTAVMPSLSTPGSLSTLTISSTSSAADVSLAGAAVATAAAMEAVAAVNMTNISITEGISTFYQNLNSFCSALALPTILLIKKASGVSSANAPADSVTTATSLLSSIILTYARLGAFQWNLNVTKGYVMGSGPSNLISNYLALINWANEVSASSTILLNLANSLNGLALNVGTIDTSTEVTSISTATPAFNTSEVTSIINAYANGLTAAQNAAHIAEAATASAINFINPPTVPHTALSVVTTATAASIVPTGGTAVLPSSIFTGNLNYALSYVNGYTTVGILDFIHSTLATHPNSLNLISQFCFSWLNIISTATNPITYINSVLLKILGFYLSGANDSDIKSFSAAVQGISNVQPQQVSSLQGPNMSSNISQFCTILQNSIVSSDAALITPILQKISNLNFVQSSEVLDQIARYSTALSALYNATDVNNIQLANLRNQIVTQTQKIAQLSIQINGRY